MSTILVVDDDAMTLRMVEYTLTGGGHQVVTTSSPEKAAELAESHGVEAVILDVLMPGRSGYEVLAELHANPMTMRIPVLMLSSLTQSSHRVKGLREGADEYIAKPFDPEELLLRLNRLLAASRDVEALFEGSLETVAFPEVVQSLLHGGKTGSLEVQHKNLRGEVVIESGRAVGATWGRLHGRQAILSMLELRSGRFRFEERPRDFESTDPGVNLSLQQAIFTSVWLQDEMGRWPAVTEDELLWVSDGGRDQLEDIDDYDALPLAIVWQEVDRHPGISVRELMARELAAPKVLLLSLRVLVHSGALRTAPQPSGDSSAESRDAGEPTLDAAVAALIRTARSRDYTSEVVHSLLVVEPSVHATALALRQKIPATSLAAPGDSFTAAWRAGRIASLPLETASGKLVLRIASTAAEGVQKPIRDCLGDMAGVAIWLADAAAASELRWLVDELSAAPQSLWGVVVATGRGACASASMLLEGTTRWQLKAAEPGSIAELLRLLAASAEP